MEVDCGSDYHNPRGDIFMYTYFSVYANTHKSWYHMCIYTKFNVHGYIKYAYTYPGIEMIWDFQRYSHFGEEFSNLPCSISRINRYQETSHEVSPTLSMSSVLDSPKCFKIFNICGSVPGSSTTPLTHTHMDIYGKWQMVIYTELTMKTGVEHGWTINM